MKLKDICKIYSGYITRRKIEASAHGSHHLMQAKNVDGDHLTYDRKGLIRFNPTSSYKGKHLENSDLLFMARGARHFTILLTQLPEPTLAAACFFIVRVTSPEILPGYLSWYLNQSPVEKYLFQHSGRNVHMPVVRRTVLENVQVPIPPLPLQSNVAEMNALMLKEINLLQQLGQKRKEMITAACLKKVCDHQYMRLEE